MFQCGGMFSFNVCIFKCRDVVDDGQVILFSFPERE